MSLIVHFSTSHFQNDNRIYYKEILSALSGGHDVVFIVQPASYIEHAKCHVITLESSPRLFRRYIYNQLVGFFKILKMRPDIVHFHDPELLIVGLLISYLTGISVIYDVHEDNYTALVNRETYKGRFLIKFAAKIIRNLELIAHKRFHLIIAEKYYIRIFPRAVKVLNYPFPNFPGRKVKKIDSSYAELIYTGNITIERGLEIYCDLVKANSNVRVHLVGKISKEEAKRISSELGEDANRMVIPYTNQFVDPQLIQQYYANYSWTAGLAVFPHNPHYHEKELTKIFEYMSNSIPVICSNFPVWENIVITHEAGVSINPNDISGLSDIINSLYEKPSSISLLGDNGLNAVRKYYTWEEQGNNLLNLYDRLLGKR